MDDLDDADWVPPPEVPIVESEVFLIPSGLPSLDEFVKNEIEKEAARLAAEASEEQEEVQVIEEVEATTQAAEAAAEEVSLGEHGEDGQAAVPLPEDVHSDEFDMPETDVKKPTKKKTAADAFEMDTVKIDFGDVKQHIEDQAREELRLRLVASTHDYIDNLIAKVVEMCEYEDPDEILRARLSKNKISHAIDEKMFQLDIEQKVMLFLNRKTVEHFRRKKATRPLMDDSPDNIINDLRKYREGLMLLNTYKGREDVLKTFINSKTAELKEQVKELENKSKASAKEFVALVKKVFSPDSSERMETLVDTLTNKVKNMRNEISKVRFTLIQRQHTMAQLQDRAKKLEDLGDGLRMADFEHLQTENQALGKKIEERNNELNRLHARCNADIHTLAHVKEKQHMIRNTIIAQQSAYDDLIEEKQLCREYLNTQKLARGAIRREAKKISFQGGLLDKPGLLLDFDVTTGKADVLRARVAEMKASQQAMENKMKHMMRSLL